MSRNLIRFLTFFIILSTAATIFARRGNPNYSIYTAQAFHIVDSDDNHPKKPTYQFVDTLFWQDHIGNKDKAQRISFPNADDSWGVTPGGNDSFQMNFMGLNKRMPPNATGQGSVSTNGIIALDTAAVGPNNSAFNVPLLKGAVAALWGDMELRTTGDTSKVFYRVINDTCYITYYNLALKGTHGKVLATFQVFFVAGDSSVQINYRSFDGSFCGEPAAKLFQRFVTIGAQAPNGQTWTNYLDRGVYHAISYGSSLYAQDLHNQLAVRFLRFPANRIRVRAYANPPSNHYEQNAASFTPQIKVDNLYTDSLKVKVTTVMTNLATNSTIYNRTDYFIIQPYQFTTIQTNPINLACGSYRLKSTVTLIGVATWVGVDTTTDPWTEDNIGTIDFKQFSNTPTGEFPNFDDFTALDRCEYIFKGVTKDSAHLLFYDPPNSASSGALIFDRRDEFGNLYPRAGSGDTLISGPFNLSNVPNKSNVWLIFSYQRGRKTDSTHAGTFLRTSGGPEALMTNGGAGVLRGDSLLIEVIPSSAATLNPAENTWVTIGKIYGGLDLETKKFRIQIPSAYVHNHTRFRIRYASAEHRPKFCQPFDDDDVIIIDELQINEPEFGRKNETDTEPLSIDMGNGNYTHIPRSVKYITPKVRIGSNGMQVNSAFHVVHLVIKDGLNREVYHRTQSYLAPGPRRDTIIPMPLWDINGSQGGKFTAKAYIELSPNEYRRINDTAIFFRTFYIDDMYALDDNQIDTAGKMVLADGNFTWRFVPIIPDSLRGFEMFHATGTGLSNWTVTFRRTNGALLGTRAFSYNASTPGWWRNTFTPIWTNDTLVMQFQLTQGTSVNGDASRGLAWVASNNGTTKTYNALYPGILTNFFDAGGAPYLTNTSVKNDTGYGPLLPMVRPIFQGSSTYLPVELLSFDAQRMASGDVRLDFRTATEERVNSFEIERQAGNNWTLVNTLAGKNARNGATYRLTDLEAPAARTTYRLWEISLDGTRSMLGHAEAGPVTEQSALRLMCVPNPARDRFMLQLAGASFDGTTSVTVFDALGKVVLTLVDVRNASTEVDARSLVPGTYYVEVTDGGQRARAKIVVTQ